MMEVVISNTVNYADIWIISAKTLVVTLNTKNCIVNSIVERYDPSKLILTPHFPPPEPVAACEENVAIFNVGPGGRNEKNAASRGRCQGTRGQSGPVEGTQLCNYSAHEDCVLSSK